MFAGLGDTLAAGPQTGRGEGTYNSSGKPKTNSVKRSQGFLPSSSCTLDLLLSASDPCLPRDPWMPHGYQRTKGLFFLSLLIANSHTLVPKILMPFWSLSTLNHLQSFSQEILSTLPQDSFLFRTSVHPWQDFLPNSTLALRNIYKITNQLLFLTLN